jgi:hypothetical protein
MVGSVNREVDLVDDAGRTDTRRVGVVILVGLPPRWIVRSVPKSRIAESLDRAVAGSVEVKGLSRSLRQEGVSDAERQKLVIGVWRKNLDLRDPPAT